MDINNPDFYLELKIPNSGITATIRKFGAATIEDVIASAEASRGVPDEMQSSVQAALFFKRFLKDQTIWDKYVANLSVQEFTELIDDWIISSQELENKLSDNLSPEDMEI